MAGMLLDTDVLIDFLRGAPAAVRFVTRHAEELHLSAITVAELFSGVRGDQEREDLETLLTVLRPLAVTPVIARDAGELRREYAPSHGVGLADCVIAATARHYELALQTLNVRHFPMFAKLKPPYRKP
jgi:hypothetical protein